MKQRPLGACFGRTVNSLDSFRCISAWIRGKGCMTSGGHHVSKILLKTRNYCIFIPAFLLLPSSWFWKLLLLDTSRLLRVGALDLVSSVSGFWGQCEWPQSLLYRVLATRSFLCTTPVGTSRWRCEQVRLPRCDLHEPLKALNIYPQNSIKLFIKSNAWNLGSPWKYYHILPEVPESSAVWCVCIFRLLIFVYHRQEGIHVT